MKTPQENSDFFVFEVDDITPENIERMKQHIAFIDGVIAKAIEKAAEKALKEIKKE